MKTERLQIQNPHHLQRAGELLRAGELVAVPTETVYGLAADATNPQAVLKIFQAKQRPVNHPLITHIASFEQLPRWVNHIPEWVIPLADAFWPGPLTLLFERNPAASEVITGGLRTIGIRMPAQPALLSLMRQFDLALAAPSANPYQRLSPTSVEQVLDGLDGKIAAVLDGGPCGVGTESTILSVSEQRAEILRSGPVSAEALQAHLSVPVVTPEAHHEAVSGNKKVHYQPRAKVMLCDAETLPALSATLGDDAGALVYSAQAQTLPLRHVMVMSNDHLGYRRDLYASLFALDQAGVRYVLVEAPPRQVSWCDIWDRLSRAAAS